MKTAYFDTDNKASFAMHHNGKLPRYKIRTRTYIDSNDQFLEIKCKNNKGRTEKKRLKIITKEDLFEQPAVISFLNERHIHNFNALKESLLVKYKRISLIHKKVNERVTLDFDLSFSNDLKRVLLGDLVFVEVKQEKEKKSPVMKALKAHNKHAISLSKYCYGLLNIDTSIKHNNFNPLLKFFKKINAPI